MNNWVVNGFEVRHVPKVGWVVCKGDEIVSVQASVADALKEAVSKEES